MTTAAAVAVFAVAGVLAIMAGELVLSLVNEASLRRQGAVEPPDDVFQIMRVVYPGVFVLMAVEGALTGPSPGLVAVAGLVVFGLGKALKLWAITSLGGRWSFRVLVLPGHPLVASGPYRYLHHPNYVAIVGEIVGVALIVWAPVSGALGLAAFGWLMWRRIQVEDRALGRQ
ncbi:MAG: hypothetical protein IT178_11620 [Acidobacteria bacterium]|nr:hypothetical protein [Acidobacteriota bacterium]